MLVFVSLYLVHLKQFLDIENILIATDGAFVGDQILQRNNIKLDVFSRTSFSAAVCRIEIDSFQVVKDLDLYRRNPHTNDAFWLRKNLGF